MSESFRLRLATPADAETIAWHRARMFQDMGEVPPNLFETFRAKSRDRLHDALAHGEYVGWLVSLENDANIVVGGAGVHLHRTLPHPLSRSALAEGRLGVIVNVFTEPKWRRRGVAESCFDESSNGREQSAWIALSFTLRQKAERSTNDSDSLQAMRCDWRPIRFYRAAASCRSRSPINPEQCSSRSG